MTLSVIHREIEARFHQLSQEVKLSPLTRFEDAARDISLLNPTPAETAGYEKFISTYINETKRETFKTQSPYEQMREINKVVNGLNDFHVQKMIDTLGKEEFDKLSPQEFANDFYRQYPELKTALTYVTLLLYQEADGMQEGVAAYQRVVNQYAGQLNPDFFVNEAIAKRLEYFQDFLVKKQAVWFESLNDAEKSKLRAEGSQAIESAFKEKFPDFALAELFLEVKRDVATYVDDEGISDFHGPLIEAPDQYIDPGERFWMMRREKPSTRFTGNQALDFLANLETGVWRRLDEDQKVLVDQKARLDVLLRHFNEGLKAYGLFESEQASLLNAKILGNATVGFVANSWCKLTTDDDVQDEECKDAWVGDEAARNEVNSVYQERKLAIAEFNRILSNGIAAKEDWALNFDLPKILDQLSSRQQAILVEQLAIHEFTALVKMPSDREPATVSVENKLIASRHGLDLATNQLSNKDIRDLRLLELASQARKGDLGGSESNMWNQSITRLATGSPNLVFAETLFSILAEESELDYVRHQSEEYFADMEMGTTSYVDAVFSVFDNSNRALSDYFSLSIEGDMTRGLVFFVGGRAAIGGKVQAPQRVFRFIRWGASKALMNGERLEDFRSLRNLMPKTWAAKIPAVIRAPLWMKHGAYRFLHGLDGVDEVIKIYGQGGMTGRKALAAFSKKNPFAYYTLPRTLRKALEQGHAIPERFASLRQASFDAQKIFAEGKVAQIAKEYPTATKWVNRGGKVLGLPFRFFDGVQNLILNKWGFAAITALVAVQKNAPNIPLDPDNSEAKAKAFHTVIPLDPSLIKRD